MNPAIPPASLNPNALIPKAATILERVQESSNIISLKLAFDAPHTPSTPFLPGQFNMVYLLGIGEVAISISSDPNETRYFQHTLRQVGHVTRAMNAAFHPGDQVGIRGPFGRGWPVDAMQHQDIVIITGGLGCAPSVSAIEYVMARRQNYGRVWILQGVKHSDDFIFQDRFDRWRQQPATEVILAANEAGPAWPFHRGFITECLGRLSLNPSQTCVLMCGPQGMMHQAAEALLQQGIAAESMYLSMERNMACGLGQCGHCQYGPQFICKNGPVFAYHEIAALMQEPGF